MGNGRNGPEVSTTFVKQRNGTDHMEHSMSTEDISYSYLGNRTINRKYQLIEYE